MWLNQFLEQILRSVGMKKVLLLLEEGLKFLILTSIISKYKDYDHPVDGIVYCVCLSQGFASLENIYYIYLLYGSSFEIAVLRAITAVPAHAMFGAIMGIFYSHHLLAKKKKTKKCFLRYQSLCPFCYIVFIIILCIQLRF